jgi:hypothetical protein
MAETNYYYIDEAGDLNDQSKFFLIGCIITDSPDALLNEIKLLEQEIKNSGYFYRFRAKFLKTGFHASTNHPDIYGRFVALLPILNFRYYAIILDKRSEYYLKTKESSSKEEIYDDMVKSLLKDRLIKRKHDCNRIYFEQNLSKPTVGRISDRQRQLQSKIEGLCGNLVKNRLVRKNLQYEIIVQDKKSQNLFTVVDFMNHIVLKIHEGKDSKVERFMKENFRLVEPKIGCIHDIARGIFHKPRKKEIDVDSAFFE